MSQSKKKITELHKKAAVEKSAKLNIYRLAVESIKTYLKVIERAGKLLDKGQGDREQAVKADFNQQRLILDSYKSFINKETFLQTISFREYLERRASGKILTILFAKLLKNSYRKRFDKEDNILQEFAQQFNLAKHNETTLMESNAKEIQRFHIMQDIVSDNKVPKEATLQKYNLQEEELLSIIQSIQEELKGIKTE